MKDIAKQIIQKEAWRRFPYRECEQGSVEDMNEENREDFIHENQWLIDALPESEWVSVESPPDNTENVLGWHRDSREPIICYYSDGYWEIDAEYDLNHTGMTHWQPLPKAPLTTFKSKDNG